MATKPSSQPLPASGRGKRLLRRHEVPAYLKEKHGLDRTVRTLAKEHSQGTGPTVAAYAGRWPLYDPSALDVYAAEKIRSVAA